MVHRGKRSKGSYQRRYKSWEQYRQELDTINGIVKSYSFHDLKNGEIVYTLEFKGVVDEKLQSRFGCLPIVNFEFGEVLNRFTRMWRSL